MMIRIDFENKSMVFKDPIKVFLSKNIDSIKHNLDEIMSFIEQRYYAVGYLSYESSEGFNIFNKTKSYKDNELPLLLFGIFEKYSIPQEEENINFTYNKLELESNTTIDEYNKNISYIKQQIEEGNTYQTNYTIQFNSEFYGDPSTYYRFLQKNNRANYCAYIQFEDLSILSISPELFFKLEGEVITTKPMKGTTARGINLQGDKLKLEDLFSEKNQAENMMIVDLLRNDLSRISEPGTVSVTKLFEAEKYPTVWQLTSTIQSNIKKNTTLYHIFQALFPCGSITGAPKASTMDIIGNIEKAPREVYCGTIGYIEPSLNKAVFNIPIRTLTINKNKASYGVGGGVTWDSTDVGEYNELLEKTAILNSNSKIPEYLIESLLLENGEFFLLDEHLERLYNSAQYFDFEFNGSVIKDNLIELSQLSPGEGYKIIIRLKVNGEFDIESNQISSDMQILNLDLTTKNVNSYNVYLYHKTSNRSHFPRVYEGKEYLLFNERGEITEFVNGNVVLFIDNKWVTPKVSAGLLPGTMRGYYLRENFITEDTILIEDVVKAKKIAFINSVRKWISIDQGVFSKLKDSINALDQ
ncbi:aminodeoxychorismate synthase component I [Photorhabdus tasmaniensis]|uniref:aminodeoxychorismate synthase component I n=1 Tax=Photorhabdus tasmaniensis TaxID=1004159 RepID=UPI004042E716